MYSSDYGYATDLKKCTYDLLNHGTTYACSKTNWLNIGSTRSLITPKSSNSFSAFYVFTSSGVNHNSYVYSSALGVRPVLYLNSNLNIDSNGDGSSGNPYKLVVE